MMTFDFVLWERNFFSIIRITYTYVYINTLLTCINTYNYIMLVKMHKWSVKKIFNRSIIYRKIHGNSKYNYRHWTIIPARVSEYYFKLKLINIFCRKLGKLFYTALELEGKMLIGTSSSTAVFLYFKITLISYFHWNCEICPLFAKYFRIKHK